jgi:hypothetical protein
MDAIAAYLGRGRAEVRETNFIQPDEMPYDHHLIFQDGRPLIYDSGDYPATLDKVRKLVGWDEFEAVRAEARNAGRRVGIGLACYVEGTGVGPYEGAHVRVETDGTVVVATGLTTQGQGHQTVFAQVAADALGVPVERVTVVTGDTRRFKYAVGTLRQPGRGDERQRRRPGRRQGEGQGPADRRRGPGGRRGRPGGGRRRGQGQGGPGARDRPGHRGRAGQPAALRLRRAGPAGHPVRGRAGAGRPAGGRGRRAGLEATDWYSPVRSTFANGAHAVV